VTCGDSNFVCSTKLIQEFEKMGLSIFKIFNKFVIKRKMIVSMLCESLYILDVGRMEGGGE